MKTADGVSQETGWVRGPGDSWNLAPAPREGSRLARSPSSCSRSASGFTRTDLSVVLTTLAVLAVLAQPILGNNSGSKSLVCMDNLRRLSAAWLAYAGDSGGKFVGNVHGGGTVGGAHAWASGWLDWNISPANTNIQYLTDPKYAALAPYLGNDATVFKCPADDYLSPVQNQRQWPGRVRSYSMNSYMGPGNQGIGPISPGFVFFESAANFRHLSPAKAFVFLEEHPSSLNDPVFFVEMAAARWIDFPASFHNGSCWFGFADGHVERRVWANPATVRPVQFNNSLIWTSTTANDPDLLWVREQASEPVNPSN